MARKKQFQGQHVLITGGSTGIGLALAEAFLAKGACITLVARTQSKLEQAVQQLQGLDAKSGQTSQGLGTALNSTSNPTVRYEVADVTVPEQIQKAIKAAQEAQGPVDVLVCNAGSSHPGYFHELDMATFQDTMQLNYFGVVATIKAAYPDMVQRRAGHICIISSTMGVMGFTGYSAYAASKHAVRGLAECLRNELQGSGVKVSIAYPPDTSTPGFEQENLTKPIETKKISALSSVFPADKVAEGIVKGIAAGKYTLYSPDIGLNLHVNLMQGLTPRGPLNLLSGVVLGGIGQIIQAVHGWIFDSIAKKNAHARFASLWQA